MSTGSYNPEYYTETLEQVIVEDYGTGADIVLPCHMRLIREGTGKGKVRRRKKETEVKKPKKKSLLARLVLISFVLCFLLLSP